MRRGMKLVSWNVNGRVGDPLARQEGALAGLHPEPDIVCLQEVTRATAGSWIDRVGKRGLEHSLDSVGLLRSGRRYANLIASRWPLELLPQDGLELPFPEKLLSGVLASPGGELEVHVAHLPPGVSYPEEKMATFEAIYRRLATPSTRPRILCGDLNTPKAETAEGDVMTWADDHPAMRERWDAAERSVLQGLALFELPDLYRQLHGYGQSEATWIPRGNGEVTRRYDHVFASPSLNPVSCEYIHAFREAKMSDHSPVEAVFDWRK